MAEKRMFSKAIIDSDAFLDMPQSSQLLYFHLSMRADDDGFINNPKKIQRMVGASDDDLRILISKKFIIPFESGIVVIKHWKIHNYIQKDRYHETNYIDEKAMLITDENRAYKLMDTKCIQNVSSLDTQIRLDKISIDKNSIDNKSSNKKVKHNYGEFGKVSLTDDEIKKLNDKLSEAVTQSYIERLDSYKASSGKKYSSDYATILNWFRKEQNNKSEQSASNKNKFHNFEQRTVNYTSEQLEEVGRKNFSRKLKEIGININDVGD